MIPKQDVVRLLEEHLGKNCLQETVDKIAQEIVDLESEWEELPFAEEEMGYTMKVDCQDICFLAAQIKKVLSSDSFGNAKIPILRRTNTPNMFSRASESKGFNPDSNVGFFPSPPRSRSL